MHDTCRKEISTGHSYLHIHTTSFIDLSQKKKKAFIDLDIAVRAKINWREPQAVGIGQRTLFQKI